MLELEGVNAGYKDLQVLWGVSLRVEEGELVALVGPNGAGKTTTLRAAAGLVPISSGTVRILGWDVFEAPTVVARHLGFTPDNPALYDGLTVEQYLDFIGHCYDLPPLQRAERIDHWLEVLWLRDKRTAKVSSLSRGMRQRLAVARTLLSDPHLILLDEPAAGLDPAGRVHFRRLLASLRDQGRAIIVSSHILADLSEYCTHIAMMERGRVIRRGTVAEVTGAAGQRQAIYQVRLARVVGDAGRRLQALPGLVHPKIDGKLISFEFDRDPTAAAELLQRLLAAGLPVAEFRTLEPDLEEAYLRSGIAQVD